MMNASRPDSLLRGLSALLGLSLVASPAAVSIVLAACILLALVRAPVLRAQRPWRHPVVLLGLVLMAWITLQTLAQSGFTTRASWRIINKYHELLLPLVLIPLFATLRRDRAFLHGLALGVLLYALAHWLSLVHEPLAEYLLTRRISAGWTLGVSAFLFLMLTRDSRRRLAWLGLSAFLALTVLVAIGGRTGHLIVIALMALAGGLLAPRRWRLAAAASITALLLGVAALSPQVGQRVAETLNESRSLDGEPISSTGIRLQLLKTAADLLEQHPVLGVGLANYASAHASAARQRLARDPHGATYQQDHWIDSSNPHNEYLMQWVGAGLPAFLLFMAWLGAMVATGLGQLRQGRSAGEAHALIGLALAFAAGCLFNSLLMDFVEGHYFIVTLSWLLARLQRLQPAPAATATA